jgi:hemolysin III
VTGKPRLRGVSHEIACYFSAIAGCYLVAQSRGPGTSSLALVGTTIYSLCLFFLFSASALYHRPKWSPEARAKLRRVDHAAIFVLIAGTATPVMLLGLQGTSREGALILMWAGATLGVLKSIFESSFPKGPSALVYVLLGLAIAPFMPAFAGALGSSSVWLLLYGSAAYILGAVIYALRKPDPFPTVFGYHEIFHALVVAAAACHYWAILQIVQTVARSS